MGKYLTVEEVAKHIRFSPRTVRDEITSGKLKAVQLEKGGKYVVSTDELNKYLSEHGGPAVPNLQILPPHVNLCSNGFRLARFVFAAVSASADAEGCVAFVDVPGKNISLPLHWEGTSPTGDEKERARIAIAKEKPVRVCIAFSLPPPHTNPDESSPEPIFFDEVPVYVSPMRGAEWDGGGCWLAQPATVNSPSHRRKSYLPPGKYEIVVGVECEGGSGDKRPFVVTSPVTWEDLAITAVFSTNPQTPG